MESYPLAIISSCWLGILTSISPCPLATNIAAISYIGKRVEKTRYALYSGLLYVIGRMLTYLVLGFIIVYLSLSIPEISYFLQENINLYLGPILIFVGLALLDLYKIKIPGLGMNGKLQNRIDSLGIWGASLLGMIFALSFCPVSAALFFGSLIPLSLKYHSTFVLPSVYGIGTGLPVIVFALVIALSMQLVGKFFNAVSKIEIWMRRITAVIFIGVGIYYVLIHIFKLPI